MEDGKARERVARVEDLLERLESLGDPVARDLATETVQALLELYGEGLARVASGVGADAVALLAEDELVAHLLLLHGLHPLDLETRVRGALAQVRPYLESHGGDVELLAVEGGVVRLRMQGSCDGCPSSAMTLKLAIEDAILKVAPDVEAIEAEGAEDRAPAPLLQIETIGTGASTGETVTGPAASPLLQIEDRLGGRPAASAGPGGAAWTSAGALSALGAAGTLVKDVDGEPVLFLRAEGGLYAYRCECPRCESSLEGGGLEGPHLTCPGCGSRFDVRRAGRSLDGSRLALVPFPLLVDDAGEVRVAMSAAV